MASLRHGSKKVLVVGLAAALVAGACSQSADVTADQLEDAIQRQGLAFDSGSIPPELVLQLADHRVVLLGETHHLREHWEFVALLMAALHDHGFRQVLVERPQMNDWLIDDYVLGGQLVPDWEPPPHFDRRFTAIRALNAALPDDEKIHVRSIDANEDYAGGATDFQVLFDMLLAALGPAEGIDVTLPSDYPDLTPDRQRETMSSLEADLKAKQSQLVEHWGSKRFDQIAEMASVETTSIDIRETRREDDESAARAREDLIKLLADKRISEHPSGTVINIGAHHAQKSHLMGTDQEWMGDYLAHGSPVADGSVFVIGFTSARTELEPGAGGTPFDIRDTSPDNEILRVMAETWPGEAVFLPLDDSLFAERTVAYNSEEVIYVTRLHDQFDALIQYGLSHRMPID